MFAEFDSVLNAQNATILLQQFAGRRNLLVSFATPPIERAPTETILLRLARATPIRKVMRLIQRMPVDLLPKLQTGELRLTRQAVLLTVSLVPLAQGSSNRRWIATFASTENAALALKRFRRYSSDKLPLEATFYHPPHPTSQPNTRLFVRCVGQQFRKATIVRLASTFPGYKDCVTGMLLSSTVLVTIETKARLAFVPLHNPDQNTKWAILGFEDVRSADAARRALNGRRLGPHALDVSFYADPSLCQVTTPTNVLFCIRLFGATTEEFTAAFATFKGFHSSKLCERHRSWLRSRIDQPVSRSRWQGRSYAVWESVVRNS